MSAQDVAAQSDTLGMWKKPAEVRQATDNGFATAIRNLLSQAHHQAQNGQWSAAQTLAERAHRMSLAAAPSLKDYPDCQPEEVSASLNAIRQRRVPPQVAMATLPPTPTIQVLRPQVSTPSMPAAPTVFPKAGQYVDPGQVPVTPQTAGPRIEMAPHEGSGTAIAAQVPAAALPERSDSPMVAESSGFARRALKQPDPSGVAKANQPSIEAVPSERPTSQVIAVKKNADQKPAAWSAVEPSRHQVIELAQPRQPRQTQQNMAPAGEQRLTAKQAITPTMPALPESPKPSFDAQTQSAEVATKPIETKASVAIRALPKETLVWSQMPVSAPVIRPQPKMEYETSWLPEHPRQPVAERTQSHASPEGQGTVHFMEWKSASARGGDVSKTGSPIVPALQTESVAQEESFEFPIEAVNEVVSEPQTAKPSIEQAGFREEDWASGQTSRPAGLGFERPTISSPRSPFDETDAALFSPPVIVEEGPRFGPLPTTAASQGQALEIQIAPEAASVASHTWLSALSKKLGMPEQTLIAFLLAGGVAVLMGFFAAIRRGWSTTRPSNAE